MRKAQFFLAERDGKVVGRISAQVDELVREHMGAGHRPVGHVRSARRRGSGGADRDGRGLAAGTGDDPRAGADQHVDLGRAGAADRGLRPSADGDDGPPPPEYRAWIEAAGYAKAKDLLTYELDIAHGTFPPIVRRIAAGEKQSADPHPPRSTRSSSTQEAAIILDILNDAWSDNWGFIPLTEAEIAYAGKKMKPIVSRT